MIYSVLVQKQIVPKCKLNYNIYTLSDLSDLSNLIGSLSRTIQQYSPPSEWIMCEICFFSLPEKIIGLTFFLARKDFEGFKTAFFSAINLASQQKTTELFFSSQVRKQFKLLAVPFKSLRCCLRSDKLLNCHV